jgi:hypothetical protein
MGSSISHPARFLQLPDAPRFACISGQSGTRLVEFPLSTVRLGGVNCPVAGGGYLRLFPYTYTRWGIRYLNTRESQPAVVYLHPWELDPAQPRLPAGRLSRFRHYTNLHRMEERRVSSDFSFGTMSEVLQPAASMPHTIPLSTIWSQTLRLDHHLHFLLCPYPQSTHPMKP